MIDLLAHHGRLNTGVWVKLPPRFSRTRLTELDSKFGQENSKFGQEIVSIEINTLNLKKTLNLKPPRDRYGKSIEDAIYSEDMENALVEYRAACDLAGETVKVLMTYDYVIMKLNFSFLMTPGYTQRTFREEQQVCRGCGCGQHAMLSCKGPYTSCYRGKFSI